MLWFQKVAENALGQFELVSKCKRDGANDQARKNPVT